MKADQEAFDNFLEKNRSFFSHHGYEEWEGSDTQKNLLAAIKKGGVTMETKKYCMNFGSQKQNTMKCIRLKLSGTRSTKNFGQPSTCTH